MTNGHEPAIRPFAAADTERVVELWHACRLIRPWNDPRKLAAVESRLVSLGCPKLNFQVRKDNGSVITFYEGLGFAEDDCLSFGKRLIPDTR